MSTERKALEWFLGGDTGISSEALCAHMLGIQAQRTTPPSDAADRGRCIRLLDKIPEWWDRLDEMKQYGEESSFVISSSGTGEESNSWAKQIPLIKAERPAP